MVILYSTSEIALIFLEIRVKFLFLLNTPRREWLAFPASHKETGWWKHLYPWILHLEAVMLVDSKSMCSRVVFSPICEGNHVIFFSLGKKGRKRVKHYFRCHVDLPFSLSFWVQFLASLVQTGMGWIYEAYLCLSRPFPMVAGAGFFITPLLSLPLHTHGAGAHICEDLSILSLAFTGDLRWLEEFAVKDTWIWVLKHLIV